MFKSVFNPIFINRVLSECSVALSSTCCAYSYTHHMKFPNSNSVCVMDIYKFSTISGSKEKHKAAVGRISSDIVAQSIKKRIQRKKRRTEDEVAKPGFWNVIAYATAEEYDLERLKEALIENGLYIPYKDDVLIAGGADVLRAVAKYKVSPEPRHLYFFREGSVVLWNVPEIECHSVIEFLQPYEFKSYDKALIQEERESMMYTYVKSSERSYLEDGSICVCCGHGRDAREIELDRYTFSNAMALTVKLGVWEASLDHYIKSVEYITEDLKSGKRLRITHGEVLRKTGELFALRHSINLSSDLLDVPDFYWDHDELEPLYNQICTYFSIAKRTRVLNEKLNHCIELVDLLSTHLNDRHHVRLEWMIIILIMVEVGFEMLHYSEFVTGK